MLKGGNLNPEQVEAVTHGNGPLLIIAGAGTGKTTVITQRLAYLILEKKVNPANILALTFTDKAASELEERIDVIMPYGFTHLWISTFHGFCDRILRSDAIQIGLDGNYKLANEAEMVLFIKKNLFSFHLDYFRPLGNPAKFIQGILQHFSRLADEDITPEEYSSYVNKEKNQASAPEEKLEVSKLMELANAYKTFEELKIKEGLFDYSDLISNTLKLFRNRKNVLANYGKQFQYILIDEFQDTNFAQNELGILLAGQQKNITVVGDDNQAIYRWRGAAISNMIQFKSHFPDTKIVSLTKNYRSTQQILDSAYTLIQNNNPDTLEVKEKINKKLSAANGISGSQVELLYSERGDKEAETVVKKIKELMRKNKYKYNDFAILVRANDHAQSFIRSLEDARMPFQYLGPGQLFHQEEIKDLIAYLKVLYNFEDSASLYRILSLPVFNISGASVVTLLNYAKKNNLSLFEVISNPEEIVIPQSDKEKVKQIYSLISKHLEMLSKESAGKLIYNFLQETGILKQLTDPDSVEQEKKLENISRFFDKLKKFESEKQENSVFAVVDWIELSMQMGESPLASNIEWMDNEAVNILTVHSSKGLEFPVVFMVNLINDRFPSRQRKEQIPIPTDLLKETLPEGDYHIQDERRLFYVGMTRAKRQLFLTASKFYNEGKRERKISIFVLEALGRDIIKKLDTKKIIQSQLPFFEDHTDQNSEVKKSPRKLSYISYSQIQTFAICPLHYKLKYILKIPSEQTSAQSYGVSLHATLRDFYLSAMVKKEAEAGKIEELLKKNWSSLGYESREHEKTAYKKALAVIRNYVTADFNPNNLPLYVESQFEFYLSKIRFGGRIDRIDKHENGNIEIIDYKTGNNFPKNGEILKNLQLTLYALAMSERLNKNPEQIMLTLNYIEENKKFTTFRTFEQLEKAKKELLEKVEEIAMSDFPCSGSILCKNCEYKILCKTKTA